MMIIPGLEIVNFSDNFPKNIDLGLESSF